jgi:acetone carboxylase gamma subunit
MSSETQAPQASDTGAAHIHWIGAAYEVVEGDGQAEIRCARCGFAFGERHEDPKLGAVVAERSIVEANELNSYGAVEEIVIREYYCPGCGAMVAVNVQRHGDAVLREIQLD